MLTILPLALSTTHILAIVLVVIILFGGRKIPELMRGMGRGMKEFKDALNKDYTTDDMDDAPIPPARKKTSTDKSA